MGDSEGTDEVAPQRYQHGFTEENWEQEIERTPFFMTKSPDTIDPDESPALAAMQALKYDSSSDDEKTVSALKADGNEFFRRKLYAKAVDAYTSALKMAGSEDDSTKVVLYTNRAAAHFHLKNYRSSLNDAREALTLKPDHVKAIVRAAQVSLHLEQYEESMNWCDKGLQVEPTHSLLIDLSAKADTEKKKNARQQRIKVLKENKEKKKIDDLHKELQKRKIHFKVPREDDKSDDFVYPHIDSEGSLHWRVQFLYPEYNQSDQIVDFNEESRTPGCDVSWRSLGHSGNI
eukprot:m.74753 g.74753  ORF g.74753 m.74753 type:complete len:289 (+) comp35913_c0_seq1:96-962(+)